MARRVQVVRHVASTRVSIVVPCRIETEAHAALLDETMCTVDVQTVDDYELIVVDDGSSADVAAIVETHRHASTIRQANAGPAAARNAGIARSRGDALVFLDADDHLLPGCLATGLAVLAAHPDCGFTVGAHEEVTFDGRARGDAVSPLPVERVARRRAHARQRARRLRSAASAGRRRSGGRGGVRARSRRVDRHLP